MKIIERSLSEEALERDEFRNAYEIVVDEHSRINVNDYGEPEDNSLGRDLKFVYSIVGLMREAYEVGKNGEPFEVTKELVDEI
jgi:hypothetical protein